MIRIGFILLIGIAALTSCEKIVAEDISEKTPIVLLPVANDTTAVNPVHFKWQEMEGATKYRLQVVSPSFSNIVEYSLDTLITVTDYYFALDSNEYEMRVFAQNAGYTSDTTAPIKFWVNSNVSSGGGSSDVVSLISPDDSAAYNNGSGIDFDWDNLTGAVAYEFSLRDGASFQTGTTLESESGLGVSHYTSSLTLDEGEYFWGVMGHYSNGSTAYSIRVLYVDTTAPEIPSLAIPSNNSNQTIGTITFEWNNNGNPGTHPTPITSTIEIDQNASFSNPHEHNLTGNSVDLDLSTFTTGTYYWRVVNRDKADNVAISAVNSFTLQ